MKRSRFPRPLRSSMELAIVIALTLAWAPWVSPALATTPSSWINFDGDGKTDPAVWRPDSGVWYIQKSSDGGMLSPQWGLGSLGDVPVPGDYDGDGKTDPTVWRPDSGVWYIQKSSDGGMLSPQWGLGSLGDVPVPGNYDNDAKTDVAVWRPDSGTWYIQKSLDGGMLSPQWGMGSLGDVPVPGDYDGDGKTDVAVWRPSTGTWFILRSSDGGMTSQQWGMSGDKPVNRPVHLWSATPTAAQNSAQALEEIAVGIYDALAAGQDLKPYIDGVMTAFGVPPLGEADVAEVDARFSQGLPLMFIPQVAEMADAFNDGGYISLDSFIASANEQGAKQKGTTDPLTRDYLSGKFAAYAGKTQYASGEVLPAFVLALGKERAKRFPPAIPDPLWGDALLDPVQLTLMLYAVSYSSAAPLPAQAPLVSAAAYRSGELLAAPFNPKEWVKDQIRDQVTGVVQDVIEVPLSTEDAAQVSVCASLLLYGHKVTVTATPGLIWHHQTDGTKPWSTVVSALLTFQDDYWDNYLPIDRWMLDTLGNCTLPRRGPVEGKPIEWSVSSGLTAHGNYNITPAATDVDGKGVANWQAVLETTPLSRRTFDNQRDAVGAAIVRAGSLVPGWSTLERIVGLLKDTGNTGDSPITVIYYVDPCKGETSPASMRGNALLAPLAGEVCVVDNLIGTSSLTIPGVFSTSAAVTWVYDPIQSNLTGQEQYYPEGTVTVHWYGEPCVVPTPSTHQVGGYLIIDRSTNPPSFSGYGDTEPWDVTMNNTCTGGGGYPFTLTALWFESSGSTSADGNTIAGTINNSGTTGTYNFTRN